jgi:predicted nucleic acid-binding protein
MATYLADTNLLLRLAGPASPQHPIATRALAQLFHHGDEVYLTPQNWIEFWAVATRPVEARGFGWNSERTTREVTEVRDRFPLLPDSPEVFAR